MASYYVYSGAAGSGNGSSWANAATTLTAGFVLEAAGDTLYVAHDHAESTASAITLTSQGAIANPTKVICVNRAGSVPPVAADRRATAQVSTTGASNITIAGYTHYDGVIFTAGSGTTTGTNLTVAAANNMWQRFDNCSLRLGVNASNAAAGLLVGSAGTGAVYVELNNTTLSHAHASNSVQCFGVLKWRNTPSALLGTMPTNLFKFVANEGGMVECIGVDLSAAGSSTTLVDGGSQSQAGICRFVDCKLNASVVKSAVPTAPGSPAIDFICSGASGINYAIYSHRAAGLLIEETTVVRTGGASDGTTPIAWKIDTTATCTYSMPFECPPIAIWNDTTGSAVTATVEGVWGGGAVPNDDDIWIDVEYLGDASSPQGSFVNDGKADLLTAAAAQTSSSATWGGSTTKFKLAASFTPAQRGWIYGRVKVGKASTTVYIDPLITLT